MGEVYGVPKLWHKGKSGDFYIMVRPRKLQSRLCAVHPHCWESIRAVCHDLLCLTRSATCSTLLPLLSCLNSGHQLLWAQCSIRRSYLDTCNVWECTSRLQPAPSVCR